MTRFWSLCRASLESCGRVGELMKASQMSAGVVVRLAISFLSLAMASTAALWSCIVSSFLFDSLIRAAAAVAGVEEMEGVAQRGTLADTWQGGDFVDGCFEYF